jgi:hypothetical protein
MVTGSGVGDMERQRMHHDGEAGGGARERKEEGGCSSMNCVAHNREGERNYRVDQLIN